MEIIIKHRHHLLAANDDVCEHEEESVLKGPSGNDIIQKLSTISPW